jgi:SynChlorMet cassette radical SAM/SPASM protein ScmE
MKSYAALKQKPLPVMHTPRSVVLEITSRCNLRCSYCYFFDNPGVSYLDLPTEEWLQFIDELGDCGVMNVTLSGGEVFIREDLPQLISGIVKNRMRFSILSNGTLIDDGIASFLAKTVRCGYVQVSIDGSSAEVHDICRGKGSFERAVRGIRILQNHDVPVTVRMTLHHFNVSDLENTAHFLLEELNLPDFSTNSAGFLGLCQKNSKDLLLNVEERQTAMAELSRLAHHYQGRISAQAGPLADARSWSRMEAARLKQAPAFEEGGRLTGCGCAYDSVAVRADGAIVPCSMLTHLELGRINQDSLTEVWQKNQDLTSLRQRHAIQLSDFDSCSNCNYVNYCTGNCPGLGYAITGQVDRPCPDACLRKFLEGGGVFPVETMIVKT